ncbi:G-type lectin S-receptor-like serine/threonine-protein kinase [Sesamum alatum]|uniref:non-specific serine/threonine protein kinase n=1 Tax=Sesamum alatum TaxID=300844 RepID=A0AAE1YTL3_9LAMI|nr:G-type lectin S-receptor-like serine/threonine-protein kinase [Sesamum alatum]
MMQEASSATLVFLIFVYCLAAQSRQVSSLDTLKPGDRLNVSSELLSANGNFSLGFTFQGPLARAYLALSHTNSKYGLVWIGNREQAAVRNHDPFLTIDVTGKLTIEHSVKGAKSIELYAGQPSKKINVSATLMDTGNFVVRDGEVILWQSFDHPTDTLLPGMKLGVNRRTGRKWILNSWFGPTDPAPGAFTLEWDPSVGQLLFRRRGVLYWTSGKLKDYHEERGDLRVKAFDNILPKPDPANLNYNFSVVTSDDEEYFTYSLINDPIFTPDNRKISAFRLDYEGYIFDMDRPSIAKAGYCYGYDESHSNPGCELRQQPKCRNDGQKFDLTSGDFRHVNGTTASSVFDSNSSLSMSDCREKCWNDCDCVGYTSGNDSSGCVYWRGKNLEFVRSNPPDGLQPNTYVLDHSAPSRRGKKRHIEIISVAVSVTVLFILGAIVALFVMRKIKKDHLTGKRKEDQLNDLLTLDGYTETYELESGGANNHQNLRMFAYECIQSATNNFSSDYKLGQGGFGPVYKGKTLEGQDIAVKLLSRQSGQGLLEFKTELILISKLQHVNLVKLHGFCVHGDDKMIIYDYMPNKSLDFFLFRPSNREQLNWQQRFNIIEGIAQGLLYLHKYSRLRIIHRDLKPSNILLDKDMNPKISDFGLARIFKQNDSEANTNRRAGTYGYMAPEYAMQGTFSVKSDVYSFGVIVLEIVSGRKNNSFHQIEGGLDLVEHAWELWGKGCPLEIMDPTLRASCITDQVQRCIHVGLLCVESHAVDRPTIEDVISMLKNETTSSLSMPKNPAFITRNSVFDEEGTPPNYGRSTGRPAKTRRLENDGLANRKRKGDRGQKKQTREQPAVGSHDPFLTVDITGKLIIGHSVNGAESIEVYAGESSEKINASATLLDTGNLVVKYGEVILWQSFDHPIDTLLPGMKLDINRRTGRKRILNS